MTTPLIGPYRIDATLSTGGLSTVYAATDSRDDRRVAIKFAHSPAQSADHASVVNRFHLETTLLRKLNHPSIPAIHEQGQLPDGSPYLVMELIEGKPLDRILDTEGRIPLSITLSIARQIAGALGAAHALGFLHRDLKPANILVLDQRSPEAWTIKLLDFGIAARLEEDTFLTRAGGFFGSVSYMSPEQIRAEPLSPRSDIWQLGVTLFEMLTGSLPFDSGDTFALMTAIMNADVKIPANAYLPEPVMAFLLRCLSKDPALRPSDGGQALQEIEQLESKLAPHVAALPANPPQSILMKLGTARAAAPGGPAASKSSPRSILFAVALGALALASILFISLGFTRFASNPWRGVLLGAGLAVSGMLLGKAAQNFLAARRSVVSFEAQDLLSSARGRERLSQTLAIQVDEIVAKCRLVDEKFLAMTLAVMVDEYGVSTTSDDRQKALMNAVALLEKLTPKLSPWYLRHDKLVALLVTLVGLMSGLVTIVQNIVKVMKGS